jgi:2,3-bisphosphoglycerate-dependent phosphoglycerate mutase
VHPRIGRRAHQPHDECALIMGLVGTPPDARVHFSHHNTGISLVHFRLDGGIRLRYLNRVPHLRPNMIT